MVVLLWRELGLPRHCQRKLFHILQLEAEHLGLGSTWVQMRLRTNGDKSAEAEVRKTLGIPDNYGVLCLLAIGHKDEVKQPRQLDAADWTRTHTERF